MKIVRFKVQSVRYKNSFVFFALLTYGFLIRNSGLLNIKSITFYDRTIFPFSCIGNIFLFIINEAFAFVSVY
jgi:hypothetical protein